MILLDVSILNSYQDEKQLTSVLSNVGERNPDIEGDPSESRLRY